MNNRNVLTGNGAALNSGDNCPECGGYGHIMKRIDLPGYGAGYYETWTPCPACRSRQRAEDPAGIPGQYRDADLSKFRFDVYATKTDRFQKVVNSFLQDFPKWQNSGTGLYFWSKTPGSGKTLLSCALGRSVSIKYDLQIRFVSVVDYLSMLHQSFDANTGNADVQVYRDCDLLILDDIGAQMKKEWYDQEIFRLVDARMRNGAITIYTANMQPEDLNVSDRTADRIRSKSIVLQLPEESIRNRLANARQNKFLETMGII